MQEVVEKSIYLSDIKADAYQISIEYFTEPLSIAAFNDIKQSIHLNVLKLLEENKIEIAGKNRILGVFNLDLPLIPVTLI